MYCMSFSCFGEYKPRKREARVGKKEKEKGGELNLEMRSICGKAFTLFFVLAIAMPLMCQATREDVSEPNIYQIDYNGPQTHALPPPGSAVSKGINKFFNFGTVQFDLLGSMPNHSGVKNIGKQKKPIHA